MPAYKRLLVASAKGGVGKSTTALGVAVAYARMGKKTLLVDLDFASRSLDILLGSGDGTVADFGDIIAGEDITYQAPCSDLPNLNFIAACRASHASFLCEEHGESLPCLTRNAVDRIIQNGDYDVLICDTGGGTEIAEEISDLFDMILITSEQSRTSIRAADYLAAKFLEKSTPCMRLVICSFDLESVKRENRAGVIEIIDASAVRCIGVVPFDKKLQKNQDRGLLPQPKSVSFLAYNNVAKRILGNDVPLFDGMGSYRRKRNRAL